MSVATKTTYPNFILKEKNKKFYNLISQLSLFTEALRACFPVDTTISGVLKNTYYYLYARKTSQCLDKDLLTVLIYYFVPQSGKKY